MKRGLWILVMLLGCSLYGCSAGRETENTAEASGLPRFEADMETVERLPVPDGLPEGRLTFLDASLELEAPEQDGAAAGEYELADTISLITVELEGNEIMTEAILDPEDIASGKSLAVVKTALRWEGSDFQVLDYELNAWESGSEIQ